MGSIKASEYCMIILLLICKAIAVDDDMIMSTNTHQGHYLKCSPSPKVDRGGISLEVRHKYGPCSRLGTQVDSEPSYVEMLEEDEARVKWLRERTRRPESKSTQVEWTEYEKQRIALPAKSGSTIGSGNFIVIVGLGTPRKDISLMFDTGSELTWTQCKPCGTGCYKQKDPIFDPRASTTYSNITCNSQLCSQVRSATSTKPGCSSSTCVYSLQYGDSSFTVGFLAKDTLSLGPTRVPSFLFGCAKNSQGNFKGSAGLLGLGRNKFSTIYQTGSNYFSYCLPSQPAYTGHLTFGTPASYRKGAKVQYTPMKTRREAPSLYFVELEGITVGGRKLSISPSVFTAGGTLMDSGTVITRLPPAAYSALRTRFTRLMSQHPRAPPLTILDTCYNFTGYTSLNPPNISLLFRDGARLDLGSTGVLFGNHVSQICLAFTGNADPAETAIIGNTQQLTVDVIYDVGGSKVGFSPGGCR